MHFVRLIPDWNSLDSVRHAHSFLEAAALVFFALLVLFDVLSHLSEDKKRERLLEKIGLCFFAVAVFAEIAAYPYGQRNDTLSEQVIRSLDTTARDAFTNASNALTKAGQANDKAEGAATASSTAKTEADKAQQKAGAAEDTAGRAVDKSNKANEASSNALGLAHDARQEAGNLRTDLDKAAADLKAAKTQLEDQAKGSEILFRHVFPRHIEKFEIEKLFLNLPPAKAEILYKEGDGEAWAFALSIREKLKDGGWDVPDELSVAPLQRFNNKPGDFIFWGVEVLTNHVDTPSNAYPKPDILRKDEAKRLAALREIPGVVIVKDATLPDNCFRIVVGQSDIWK